MKEKIEERLSALKEELKTLQVNHDLLVAERNQREKVFGEQVQANQIRFQQLHGAIENLSQLLNGEHPK